MTEQRQRPAPPETLDDDPPVETVMSRRLVGVDPAAPLPIALRLMVAATVRHLPVVREGRCLGMIAEVDLLRGLAARQGPFGPATLLVADVLRPAPEIPPGTPLHEVAARMDRECTDALLVVEAGRPLGIVTATDLVQALAARIH
ncbi:CBS domain-containing protein [Pseudonocardia sp. RS11V-5]|uniref:CBS domain-containing protein n=1 Tax=Pseudonocardia terrae TaxID=2905831 RepID=UPI001E5C1968|nr:CBS domain-containing protein [Pseudonocardia terrae]MCE3555319.1 CBS domain-containing protein [Pseudonocardia terrae]